MAATKRGKAPEVESGDEYEEEVMDIEDRVDNRLLTMRTLGYIHGYGCRD